MSQRFKNQLVCITGASSGFGEATAFAFAKEGARLILIARRKDVLEDLKKRCEMEYGSKVHILDLDVSDAEEVASKMHSLPEDFSAPDILLNNAGLARGTDKIWEMTAQDCDEVINVNVKGILNLCREVIPKMLKKNHGTIINMGSASSHEVYPGGGVYCATKHAVKALTTTLRMELVATPVRVSMISPGIAKTNFSQVRFKGNASKADSVYEGIIPLTSEDIAEVVLFIASRPPHMNIADMIIYPTHQASALLVHRSNKSGGMF